MSFRPFCAECGTERRTGSSNRNFEFDYCINCKKTTSFALERAVPTRLVAANLEPIESDAPLPTLRFDIAREHTSLFDADEELTQIARNGVGPGAVSVPILTDARLHSGSFVVEFVVSGADKGAGLGVGFGLVWNVGVQLSDRGLGATPTTWALDPAAGTIRNNDTVIVSDERLRLIDGRGHVHLHLQLPRDDEPGSATFMVQQNGEQTCVPSTSIALSPSAVLVAAANVTAKGQRVAVSMRRNQLVED